MIAPQGWIVHTFIVDMFIEKLKLKIREMKAKQFVHIYSAEMLELRSHCCCCIRGKSICLHLSCIVTSPSFTLFQRVIMLTYCANFQALRCGEAGK